MEVQSQLRESTWTQCAFLRWWLLYLNWEWTSLWWVSLGGDNLLSCHLHVVKGTEFSVKILWFLPWNFGASTNILVFSAQTVSTAQAKLNNRFEIELGVEQQFPRNLFQKNKAFTVSDNKIFILQLNNANSMTKHRTMQSRCVRLHGKLKRYCDR